MGDQIQALLAELEKSDRSGPEGKRIRTKLRALGYYLSKQQAPDKPAPKDKAPAKKRDKAPTPKGKVALVLEINGNKTTYWLEPGQTLSVNIG